MSQPLSTQHSQQTRPGPSLPAPEVTSEEKEDGISVSDGANLDASHTILWGLLRINENTNKRSAQTHTNKRKRKK